VARLTTAPNLDSRNIAPRVARLTTAPNLDSRNIAPLVARLTIAPNLDSRNIAPRVARLTTAPNLDSRNIAPRVAHSTIVPQGSQLSVIEVTTLGPVWSMSIEQAPTLGARTASTGSDRFDRVPLTRSREARKGLDVG
jgi:hypothetical protein